MFPTAWACRRCRHNHFFAERFVTSRIEKIARKIAGLNTPSRPAPSGNWG
jgi:hypothetical protein